MITFTVIASEQDATLNLLYIYDKSERDSITPKEIEALLTKERIEIVFTSKESPLLKTRIRRGLF